MVTRDELVGLLFGFRTNFQKWQAFNMSLEEFDLDDPNRPSTEPWINDLAWTAEWRASLEYQLRHLRRMVAPYAADKTDMEKWTIQDLFKIMGESYVDDDGTAPGSGNEISPGEAPAG